MALNNGPSFKTCRREAISCIKNFNDNIILNDELEAQSLEMADTMFIGIR